MKTFKQHILEKLKITKSSGYKMTLKEFAKERKSLNDPKNNVKLTSEYKMTFIKWVEKMLVEDDVVDEIPIRGHILYFDGDVLLDIIRYVEIDPPVSTELYLTWGEAYMRIVTYYIKNNIFKNSWLITEKLKVSKTLYEDITYEKFIDEFQKMDNPDIHFGSYLDLIGGDYPTFKPYHGMNVVYSKYAGKKFKSMTLERKNKNQIELHLNFRYAINGTTGFTITNTEELYNCLGAEQVYILYDLIKELVDSQ